MRQVFITGASSDIGIELCRLYLEKGWQVLAHYNRGQNSFWRLTESSDRVTPVQIDFSNHAALESKLSDIRSAIEESDCVINAAAELQAKPFADIQPQDLMHLFAVNVVPAVLITRMAVPPMVERGWGRIINLSSIGAKFGGGSSTFGYSLTKHALEFLPSDYRKWAASNVLINTVRVGVTETRIHDRDSGKDMSARVSMIPMGRMALPGEIANFVYWYGSEDNTYVTGQTVTIAGGE